MKLVGSGGCTPTFLLTNTGAMSRETGDTLERELEERVGALGYELVEVERAGSKTRPILRLRIDLPETAAPAGPEAGALPAGVTLDDCARVSRALEPTLEERPDLDGRYVLEVSSPGVERPLVRSRDFERFAGREVALKGYAPLAGRARRLEGELLGLIEHDGAEQVRLRLEDGEEVGVPRAEIARANLIFRWGDAG